MGVINQEFPIRDGVCGSDGPMPHFVRYFYRSTPQNILGRSVYLGTGPVGADDVIDFADRQIEATPRNDDMPQVCHTLAASMLRLCVEHAGGPEMEVVQGIVVVPPGGADRQRALGNRTRMTADSRLVPIYLRDRAARPGDVELGVYLPHGDYDAAYQEHDVIASDRGGYSYPLLIGLLGDEVFVERPVLPRGE